MLHLDMNGAEEIFFKLNLCWIDVYDFSSLYFHIIPLFGASGGNRTHASEVLEASAVPLSYRRKPFTA